MERGLDGLDRLDRESMGTRVPDRPMDSDERDVVLSRDDGLIVTWRSRLERDASQGEESSLFRVFRGHSAAINGVLTVPDGKLISWSRDKTLRSWDCRSGTVQFVLEGHTGSVRGASVGHSGRLVSWGDDGTLRLWDLHSGTALAQMPEDADGARLIADGRLLSWSKSGKVSLWDASTGARLATMAGPFRKVIGAGILPDGRIFAWDSVKYVIFVWNDASGDHPMLVKMSLAWSENQEIYRAWKTQDRRPQVCTGGFAEGRRGSILRLDAMDPPRTVHWHADGRWEVHGLQEDGTLVASCDRQLAFLHLYSGDRRVTLKEANRLEAEARGAKARGPIGLLAEIFQG